MNGDTTQITPPTTDEIEALKSDQSTITPPTSEEIQSLSGGKKQSSITPPTENEVKNINSGGSSLSNDFSDREAVDRAFENGEYAGDDRSRNPFSESWKTFKNVLTKQVPGAMAGGASAYLGGDWDIPYTTLDNIVREHPAVKNFQKDLFQYGSDKMQEFQESQRGAVTRLQDIGDTVDAINWLGNSVAQGVAQIPMAVLTRGLTSVGQETGIIYMDQVEKIAEREGITPEEVIEQGKDNPANAIAWGAVAGGLDLLGAKGATNAIPFDQFKKDMRKRGLLALRQKGGRVGKAAAGEFVTEGSQSGLEQVGADFGAGKSLMESVTGVSLMEMVEEAAAGAAGGGGINVAMQVKDAVVNRGREKGTPVEPAPETEDVQTEETQTEEPQQQEQSLRPDVDFRWDPDASLPEQVQELDREEARLLEMQQKYVQGSPVRQDIDQALGQLERVRGSLRNMAAEQTAPIESFDQPTDVLDGTYEVSFTESDQDTRQPVVRNKSTGQEIGRTSPNYLPAVSEFITRLEDSGQRVDEQLLEQEELLDEGQYINRVNQESDSPTEILEAIDIQESIAPNEAAVLDDDLSNVLWNEGYQPSRKDLENFGDPVQLEGDAGRFYRLNLRKEGTENYDLGNLTDIANEQLNTNYSPSEVLEHWFDYQDARRAGEDPTLRSLKQKFQDLTGIPYSQRLADEVIKRQAARQENASIQEAETAQSIIDNAGDQIFDEQGELLENEFSQAIEELQQTDPQLAEYLTGQTNEQPTQRQTQPEAQPSAPVAPEQATEGDQGASQAESTEGINIGDVGQWTSQGVDQFQEPRPVTDVQTDQNGNQYVQFEGSQTYAPASEVTITNRSTEGSQESAQEYGQSNRIISPDRANRAREEIRKRLGGQFNSQIDPTLIKEMMELGLYHLEAGSRKFADFASAMIDDVGGKIKPYLRAIYKQAKYRSNLPTEEFSSDEEIIQWEQQNLQDDNKINSINKEFRAAIAEQEAQGYKNMGRPDLANPVNFDEGREAVDFIDEKRKEAGIPSRRSDQAVFEDANRRLEENYEAEKQRLIQMAQEQNAGQWSDVDVKMAKIIMGRESREALSTNNENDLFNFFLFSSIYRQAGTEQARAFRMRRDDTKSPAERKAEMVKEVVDDTRATVDIITEIHDLAQQARRGEITESQFKKAVRDKLGEYTSQRNKSSIQSWSDKLFGKEPTDGDLKEMYEAGLRGEDSLQSKIQEKSGKLNVPQITIANILRLESLIENIEAASPGRAKNQAVLELIEFVDQSNITGGRFSRGMKAAVEDILNNQSDIFDRSEDLIENVREFVMENITQALLTPPKEVQIEMDSAETDAQRQEIWDQYYQRFQSIKEALKNEDGIDIENLSNEDIKDPVLMNEIIRKFQAANANSDSKLYEFWNNSILSAIPTHVVNTLGTGGNMFYKSVPIRFYEAFVNTFAQDPNSAQWGEFKYFWKGFFTSVPEAVTYSTLAFQTETRLFSEELGLESGSKKFQDKLHSGVAIKGKLGRAIRAMGWRPLTAMDEFFKVMSFRMQLSAEAYREARRQGLEGEEIARFIERTNANPTGRMAESAWGWALEVAFQEDPGPITSAFVDLRNKHELVKYALPFVKTPGNLLKQGFRKGPYGALNIIHRTGMATAYKLGLSKDKKWVYSKSEITQHMAEQFAFWTALVGMGMLINSDEDDDGEPRPWITGSGASYRDQAAYRYQQQNFPPQSIRWPGTDRYYSYRRFDPFATMIANTVDAIDAVQSAKDGQEVMDVTEEFFEKNLRNIQDKSYFQSIGDLTRFMQYPGSGLDWMGNFAASWLPNIIKQGVRATDDYVREYSKGERAEEVSDVVSSVMKKTGQRALPLPSNQPPPRIDWLGYPVKRDAYGGAKQTYLWRALSPVMTIDNPPTDYDLMVMNWNNQNPNKVWYPTVPNDNISVNGEKVQLNQEQYFDYVSRRGFHTQRLLDENYYKFDLDLPSEDNIETVKRLQTQAARIAREEMLNEGVILPPLPE